MTIDLFSTRTMLEMVAQLYPPPQFLLDLFFKRETKSLSEYVDIDFVRGNKKLAPYVRPIDKGKFIEKTGYTTKTFRPPYLKPKMKTDAQRFLNRLPGEHIYQGATSPEARAAKELAENMIELQDLIKRREEQMAAQLLQTFKVTVVGDGINAEIDFGTPSGHAPTASTLWGASGSDALANLVAWSRLVRDDSGVMPDTLVLGASAANEFIDDSKVQSLLDFRRVDIGIIKPDNLPQGAAYVGHIQLPDLNLDIYSYTEKYTDDDDNDQYFVAANKAILGSTRTRNERHYGAIQDLKFTSPVPVRWFPKSWEEEDPSARILMLQSAPLPCLHQPDAFLCATVTA